MKSIRTLLIIGCMFCFSQFSVASESTVNTSVIVNYQIQPDGSNQVQQQITLTNTTASSYVTQYILELSSNRIQNISATNQNNQPIPFSHEANDTSTIILFQFQEPVVGLDQSRIINVTYTNPDVSYKVGNILEINIPQILNPEQYTSYQTNIIVPTQLGLPSAINPPDYQLTQDQALTTIAYSKDQLQTGGLILFGNEQYYRLKAKIPLSNESITPIDTQFVIPPDTNYQKVFINTINPPPRNLQLDQDGNWVVTYRIEAKQQQLITLDQSFIVYNQPTNRPYYSPENLNQYLTEQPYWETSDPKVNTISQQYTTPSQIYQYLVSNFQYNYARIDHQSTHRLGAKQALIDPQNALCLEFADSYIALSRNNNIPARLVTGFAYTQNPSLKPLGLVQNSLHAWVEYYQLDDQVWRAVDPTWGSTTNGIDYFSGFDFNHITYAILGSSSESPLPIGFNAQQNANVDVSFLNDSPQARTDLDFKVQIPLSTNIGLTDHANVTITNNSNHAMYHESLSIQSASSNVSSTTVNQLLPLTQTTVQIQFSPDQLDSASRVTLNFYDQTYTQKITLFPSYIGFIIFAVSTGVAASIGILAYKSRRILVS